MLLMISGYISTPLADYILQTRHCPQHQRGMIILLILNKLLVKRARQTCNTMAFKSKIRHLEEESTSKKYRSR